MNPNNDNYIVMNSNDNNYILIYIMIYQRKMKKKIENLKLIIKIFHFNFFFVNNFRKERKIYLIVNL